VTTLASTGAAVLVLVSCDPASLARDSALLVASGYDLERVTVVDLFGQSSHVETVSRFVRR
jgi:23S rRNA (uracil1939-C5)-methyltransferase